MFPTTPAARSGVLPAPRGIRTSPSGLVGDRDVMVEQILIGADVFAHRLLHAPIAPDTSEAAALDEQRILPRPCRCCGGRMRIIETFLRGQQPKHRPTLLLDKRTSELRHATAIRRQRGP